MHAAPRPFLLIALNEAGSARLTVHLNDQFFISHKHDADDGYPNLEEMLPNEVVTEDNASTSSVVRTSPYALKKREQQAVLLTAEVQYSHGF